MVFPSPVPPHTDRPFSPRTALVRRASSNPSIPPTRMSPPTVSGTRKATMMKNCSTSLYMVAVRPPIVV